MILMVPSGYEDDGHSGGVIETDDCGGQNGDDNDVENDVTLNYSNGDGSHNRDGNGLFQKRSIPHGGNVKIRLGASC